MQTRKIFALLLAIFMVVSLAACQTDATQPAGSEDPSQEVGESSQEESSQADEGKFQPGTYTGSASGFGGELTLEVVLSADKIESVTVTGHSETEGIGTNAIDQIPGKIVDTQSIQVDSVSGATITSGAILSAVTSALADAGVDADSLTPADGGQQEAGEQTLSADVVVVGGGGAGMTAAIEATSAGKSVILVEKTSMLGGNTTRSTGGMNAAETPEQAEMEFAESAGVENMLENAKSNYGTELADLIATVEQQYADYQENPEGYFDTCELFMLDTLVGGQNVNDPALVEVLTRNSADGISWLHSIGADLSSVGSFGGASVKRIHRPVDADGKTIAVGSYIVPILEQNVRHNGVEILMETTATDLIVEDGAVVGVKAESGAVSYTLEAGAVVIATGGFGANEEMYTSYQPSLAGFVTTNAPGITGDGIVMAEAIGAATVDMEQIQIHPTVEQETSALITEGLRGDGAILVNADGERFFDEVGTRDAVSAAIIAQPGSSAYLIVDQAMVDASSVIGGYINAGYTVQGETYEDLAQAIGADPETLAATMETWNASVAAGSDSAFGRTSFANPLDTAPYYAIKIAPGVHHTMGGLKIDTTTQVLDADGNAIPGLYAAGEVTGGVHGANRLGGNAVADIIVYGRIAGQQAASYVSLDQAA